MLPNEPTEHLCAPSPPLHSDLPPRSQCCAYVHSGFRLPPFRREHEYRSVAILRDLVKRNDLEDRLTPEMIEDVGALIAASSDEQAYLRATQRPRFRDKRFLVDIVANYRTSARRAARPPLPRRCHPETSAQPSG